MDRVWCTWEAEHRVRIPRRLKRDREDEVLRDNHGDYDLADPARRGALLRRFEDAVERQVREARLILRENRSRAGRGERFVRAGTLAGNLKLAWFVAEYLVPFERLLARELRPGHLPLARIPWGIVTDHWNLVQGDPSRKPSSAACLTRRYYLAVNEQAVADAMLAEFAGHVGRSMSTFLGPWVADASEDEYHARARALMPSPEALEFARTVTQQASTPPGRDELDRAKLIALHVLVLLLWRAGGWDMDGAPSWNDPLRYWLFLAARHGRVAGPVSFRRLGDADAKDVLLFGLRGANGLPLGYEVPNDPWTMLLRVTKTADRSR